MIEINEQFHADLESIQAQMAAWLDLHSSGGYRCLRCGEPRWYIAAVRQVKTEDYRVYPTPGSFIAVDIECLTCHRLERYNVSPLRLFP